MNKQKELRKLKAVTQKIIREYAPEKIILFGSYAWGIPTEDSDFDLLVVKKSKKNRLDRERELRMKLLGNHFPPLELLIYTPDELNKRVQIGDFFIKDILKRGKKMYG